MKKLILFLCLGFLVVICSTSFANAALFNGHEYQVISDSEISWADARSAAQSMGAGWDLATITSEGEENFIESLLTLDGRDQFWLGGYQFPATSTSTANWNWVTGEAWSYTKWGEGQPDDWMGDQVYLALDSDQNSWGWDDNTSTLYVIRGYIAENHAVPEASTMLLLGFGLISLAGFARRKFKK